MYTTSVLSPHTLPYNHIRTPTPSHTRDVIWLLWHNEVRDGFHGMPYPFPLCLMVSVATANWSVGPDFVYMLSISPLFSAVTYAEFEDEIQPMNALL